ncbi:hypothetical protein SAMN04488515_0024 [Cognatiyoonia koreensis]|uniref:Metallo-peptidase family M12B Reprolysin-like n=1 Tax=Cognatiyoonia koreensis TaxID=364200 RepID=A0A1I0MHT3_9RHOB|nr:hypothetical protein [Cognatiyoonia koreensis]SEV87895.1 hypothetical protein SAMN04488515_0024 [Cognatiyoonia koreensis]
MLRYSSHAIAAATLLFAVITNVASSARADHTAAHNDTVPGTDVAEDTSQEGRVRHPFATSISEIRIPQMPGQTVQIRAVNVRAVAQPAFHLLRDSDKTEVMFDSGTSDANPTEIAFPADDDMLLVIRSTAPNGAGLVDLMRDGQPWMEDVPFGGAHLRYQDLMAGEALQTVGMPNGPEHSHTIYVLDSGSQSIVDRASSGGVGGASKMILTADLGTRTALVGIRNRQSHPTGIIRVVRNDSGVSGSDVDGDTLGTLLERSLGTCDSSADTLTLASGTSFDCAQLADTKDSDGDGLQDDWETLGVVKTYQRSSNVRVHEAMTLPAWGANPRHKDIFIEIDYAKTTAVEMPRRVNQATAQAFASFFADTLDVVPAERLARRAASLRNLDEVHGISVHLDIGRAPATPAHATIYGDWGGYSVLEPSQEGVRADYKDAWVANMSPARRGIFRYIMAHGDSGGQTAIDNYSSVGPVNNQDILAHEFGHALGLGHSGVDRRWGDVDPNCMPVFPSLISYAYQNTGRGFSDGEGRSPLNNAALTEFQAVDPGNDVYLDDLDSMFRYWIDRTQGHVDWNRDGVIAPAGETVRAYANFRPGTSCEFTRYNRSILEKSASLQAPGMTRLNGKLIIAHSTLGLPFLSREISNVACATPSLDPCFTWTIPSRIPGLDATGGIDVAGVAHRAEDAAIVVTIGANGSVMESRLTQDASGANVWSAPSIIAEPDSAKGEPSLAKLGHCKLVLAYTDPDGFVVTQSLTCADDFANWGSPLAIVDQNGDRIALPDGTSPGIGRGYLDQPGRAELYGAFAQPFTKRLALYQASQDGQTWTRLNFFDGDNTQVAGRPSMAWVSFAEGDIDYPGRLYVLFIRRDEANDFRQKARTIRMLQSYVRTTENADGTLMQELRVGLASPFDNASLFGFGVDVFFQHRVDSNLRSVHSIAINKPANWAKLEFRPKADGIHDFEYANQNDWEVIGNRLCRNLVSELGSIFSPDLQCD